MKSLILCLLVISSSFLHGQKFEGLGLLSPPDGDNSSSADDVSADGSIVVGSSQGKVFKWTEGVMQALTLPPGESRQNETKISGDGSAIAVSRAYILKNGEPQFLADKFLSRDLSNDGTVIAGISYIDVEGSPREAPARLAEGAVQILPLFPGKLIGGSAAATSYDGSVIVGRMNVEDAAGVRKTSAFRWEAGITTALPFEYANEVSLNGKAVVGWTFGELWGPTATIWEDGVYTNIGSGAAGSSIGFAISSDGTPESTIVVGQSRVGFTSSIYAFIWTRAKGMRNLKDVLVSDYGMNLEGWTLLSATAITPDGRVIVGHGQNPQGLREGWRVELPEITFSLDIPNTTYEPKDTFPATISIRSSKKNPVTVTFDKPILVTDVDGVVVFDDTIDQPPFVLDSTNPSKTIEIQLQADKRGLAELSTSATVVDIQGTTSAFTASTQVVVNPLKISVLAKPEVDGKPILNMTIDEEGKLLDETGAEVALKVEVILENLSDQTISSAIQGVDPRARDSSSTVDRIELTGTFPNDVPNLVKGTPIAKEFDVTVNEDGRYEFTALVTSSFAGSSFQFNASRKGATVAVGDKFPVEIEMQFVRTTTITNQGTEAFFVTPGGEIQIIANVNNKTTNSILHFKGLEAEKHLNAFYSILTSNQGNLVEPPFAHDHEIKANKGVTLTGFIRTDAFGAPSGSVKWILPENAYLIDDETDERRDLTPDDMLVTTEIDGWLSDENSLRIIQDNSKDLPTILTEEEALALVVGNFTKGTLISMAKWTGDSLDAIGGIGRVAGRVSADPSLLTEALGEGSRAVWESAEMIHLGWSSMSPGEKDAFVLQGFDEVFRRAQFIAGLPFDSTKQDEVLQFTRNSTFFLFNGVEEAYATDDPAKIAELYGNITGNIAMEVLTAALPDPKFTRFAKGGEVAKLAKAADNVRDATSTQQRILRTIPSGPLTRKLAIDGWGIGGDLLDDVQEILGRLKMKGYARERSPRSLDLSEVLDEAVLKPEAMKPKGISDLDKLIFGNDIPTVKGKDGNDLDLDSITALIWPPENALIEARLSGQSKEMIEAVLARADARRKEYKKHFPEFKKFSDPNEGIPVEFNYKDNDVISPVSPDREVSRDFKYETIDTSTGARIHIPRMKDKAGNFRLITGDVDWVHFSWLDGTPLDPKTAGELYKVLSICCGLQHGATASWIKNGQAVFSGKANQIGEYITGQKALLEVSGEAIRSVRIRPNLTSFARNGRSHYIYFDGGIKSLQKSLAALELENALGLIFSALPARKVVLPFMWFAKNADFSSDPTIDGQNYTYSDDPDAVMARQGDDGSLERFDGQSWIPWDSKQDPSPSAGALSFSLSSRSTSPTAADDILKLTPTTILGAAAKAGATILPVVEMNILWAAELEGHLDSWFKVGDTILIAPGTSVQETRRIVSLSPFTIDQGLANNHPEDTFVSVVPEVILSNLNQIQAVRIFWDQPIFFDGTVSFEMVIPFDTEILLETSTDLKIWVPIKRDEILGGQLESHSLKLNYPGEPVFVIIELDGTQRFIRWSETAGTVRR